MRNIAFALTCVFVSSLIALPASAQVVAQSQKAKPACGSYCQAYCQKRVAAGTSVGFSKCMQACNANKANGNCM